jgi:hypothetical protein
MMLEMICRWLVAPQRLTPAGRFLHWLAVIGFLALAARTLETWGVPKLWIASGIAIFTLPLSGFLAAFFHSRQSPQEVAKVDAHCNAPEIAAPQSKVPAKTAAKESGKARAIGA